MAKSKEELIYDIENNLVDSNTGKITGETVKARLLDMVDAMGTGGGGAMEYWSIPADAPDGTFEVIMFAFLIKGSYNDSTVILPAIYAYILESSFVPLCFAIERNARTVMPGNGSIITIGDMLDGFGVNFTDLGLVQIDEETFYTI